MEDQFDEHVDKSETFEDIYHLAVQIDDANLKKLRQELQQVRFEIAETQAKVNTLRTTPSSDSTELTQTMRAVADLRKTQSGIVAQINSSILNQAGTVDRMAKALSTLNAEMTSGNLSSQNLASYLSVIEGAIARMTSVSKKSEDFKKLQSSLSDVGIDVNVQSIRGASRDVNKLREDVEAIDDTPVRITVDGQHVIQTVASQIQHITDLSKQLSAELNRNVALLTEMNGVAKASIITPSAYTGRVSMEGKPLQRLGSIYDIASAQALPSQQSSAIPPNEVVRAAYFGAPIFWRNANQQVATSRNTMEPRGIATADTRARIMELGLAKQVPALHQFASFENSTFLNTSDVGLINKHFQEFLRPIDPTILSGLKTLESKYNKGEQIRNRSQIGQVIRNISADKLASAMDKAYYYQLAKMVALYQQDLEDTGSSHYYMRGRPSLDLNDRQLYMLNMINQFGGTLQTSEISRSLGTGHYQGVAADVRTLLSKGLISRAIIPPFPIPSAGIPNMIAPQIMAANLLAPNVGLDAAMATTMIKPLSTTDLGKRVLAMVGMTGAPSNVDGDVFLNKFVDKVENVLVEKQPVRFGVKTPDDPRLWFSGVETKVYGENKLGDRIVYYMEEFVNNLHAIKPEYVKNLLPFIPYFEEAGRKRIDVEALRSGAYNLTDISTAKYLNARSDIYNVLQTPHLPIDKIMQMWASPNRDVFTEDMAGSNLYRKSVLWWASGPAGIGVNPQLGRYTTNPEQAIQHLNTLYSGYATDKFLSANADAYKSLTGEDYQGFSHYERSIIVRAMQDMLTRAVPVTSGFDVAANEAFRVRPSMSKSEARTMRDMLFKVRQEELENLVTNVPDLGRIIKAIEKHNDDIMASSTTAISEVVKPKPSDAYPLTPDQMANVFKRSDLPTSWKKHAAFFGATPGMIYEDTYSLDRVQSFRNIIPDPNVLPMSVAAVGGVSYAKQLGTSHLPSDVTKFKRQSELSPIIGFSGRLPWDAILKHRISMGSPDIKTPEAQAELERLLANPQELMKELFWDEDELIKETYGTAAVKTPLFYRSVDLPEGAMEDLQKRTADYRPDDVFAELEKKRKQHERMKGTVYERPAFHAMKAAQQKLQDMETLYNAEVDDWIQQWRVDQDTSEYIANPYKMTNRGTVADFYTYKPASVDKQKVIERMDYERQQGLMDPGLVEQYARTIANFRTNKDTGRTFKQGIEALFTGQDWSREAMPELKGLGEQLLLHGFLRHGSEGTFDLFHRNNWDVEDFSVQTIIDSMGHDTSMMTDEDISKYLQEDPDFQSAVREAFMADQDLTKEQYNVLTESMGAEMRQLAKKFGHLPEFRTDIEDYVGRVMDAAAVVPKENEGRYPIGMNDIFVEKPEESASTLPGGYALIDVLKQVAWKEGKKKQLSINEQKKALHAALIEWRKKDEDNYYFSDSYDDSWIRDPEGTLAGIASTMPVLPSAMPMVMLDKGTDSGRYSFIKNTIGISPQAGQRDDFENIMKHELMHPLAYEKLLAPGGFASMKGFYGAGQPMFQHSINKGLEAISAHKSAPLLNKLSRYLDQLSKSLSDEEFQNEMRRLNPYNAFYKGASEEDIGLLSSFGEEISMVMAAYDDDVAKHVKNLESRYGPGEYADKVNFIRSFVGAPGGQSSNAVMPPYINPSMILAAMDSVVPNELDNLFSTGAINPLRAGGPSYRNVMRGMRGNQPLFGPADRLALPMAMSEKLYRRFEERYINKVMGPEPLRYLPSGSGIPEGYTGIPGGMMTGGEGPYGTGGYTYLGGMGGIVMDRTGTMLGGNAGVMYPGASQAYNAEQVKAYRQRTFNMAALPAGSEGVPEAEFTVNPTPLNIPELMYGMSWKKGALDKLNASVFGKIFGSAKGFVSKVSEKHQQNLVNIMERMQNVSFDDPSKVVTGRGMEVPLSYIIKGEMFGGDMKAMRQEMDRFFLTLEDQGIDTSKLKHNILRQGSPVLNEKGKWERTNYGQIQIFGKARLGEEAGKSEEEFADILRGNMTMGFSSVNEQGATFEKTIPRINSHMERFVSYGHKVGDMSWKFTTLQMAALGVFFSMMSIMSLMSTGIGLVTGGLGDLEGMMKAKAMAGMSGQFKDKEGNVLTGAYIDQQMGVTDEKRIEAWKIWTDLVSTISTIISDFGINIATDPKFIESSGKFLGKLLDTLKDPKSLESAVNLSSTLFDTLGDIVSILLPIIKGFDMIASFKMPEWIPLLGGKSALAIGAGAAIVAAAAMPVLAGATLFSKAGRGVGMGLDAVIGATRWSQARGIGGILAKEGVDPDIIKLVQQEIKATGGYSKMALEHPDIFKKGLVDAGQTTFDDFAKAGVESSSVIKTAGQKVASALDDFVLRILPIIEKLPGGAKVVTAAGAGIVASTAVTEAVKYEAKTAGVATKGGMLDPILSKIPGFTAVSDVLSTGNVGKILGRGEFTPSFAKGIKNPLLYMLGELGLGYVATAAGEENAGEWKGMEGFRPDQAKATNLTWAEGIGEFGASFIPHLWPAITAFNAIGQFKYGQDRAMGIIPQEMSYQDYKDYSLNLAAENLSETFGGMFDTTKQANGMTEDPLNSKWTKESGASFTQHNEFKIEVPMIDQFNQLVDVVNKIAKQVGV